MEQKYKKNNKPNFLKIFFNFAREIFRENIMKRIFFLVLMISNLSFSQVQDPFAYIDLTNIHIGSHAKDRLCTSITEIKAFYEDGEYDVIFYSDDNSNNNIYPPNRFFIGLRKKL